MLRENTLLETSKIPESLERIVQSKIASAAFCKLAVVVSYNGDTVNAKPIVSTLDVDGSYRRMAEHIKVPLFSLGGGGWTVKIEPSPGDLVLLLYSDEPLDEWKNSGSTNNNPESSRHNDLSDAIAIPTSFGNGAPSQLTLTNGTISITLSSTGVRVQGNLEVTGDVTAFAAIPATTVSLGTHIHPIGNPNTGAPIPGGV